MKKAQSLCNATPVVQLNLENMISVGSNNGNSDHCRINSKVSIINGTSILHEEQEFLPETFTDHKNQGHALLEISNYKSAEPSNGAQKHGD